MYVDFHLLPDHSRIWLYQAEQAFSTAAKDVIASTLKNFCEGWNTHGKLMPTSFLIIDDQILILAVDESGLGASGCSIDSSVRVLRELEDSLGINLTDQGKVSYKTDPGTIRVTPALGVKSKVTTGEINRSTEVVNPQIRSKKELDQLWIPASKSWLNKYFPN